MNHTPSGAHVRESGHTRLGNIAADVVFARWGWLNPNYAPRIINITPTVALYNRASRTPFPSLILQGSFKNSTMKAFLCLPLLFVVVKAAKPTVYLIRHGEKPVSGDGLSAQGLRRAQCLRNVFGTSSGYNIGHIMAQAPGNGRSSLWNQGR